MLIIYRAANIADAYLIRLMLESEGIPALIQGEYLQSTVGELPANTEIIVHVGDDNAHAARAIVDKWESAEPVVLEDKPPEDSLPEALPQRASGDRYALAKGAVLFVAVVVAGAVAMSPPYRYAQG